MSFALQGSRSLAAHQPSGSAAHSQQQQHMEASPVVAAVRTAASAALGCHDLLLNGAAAKS